MDFGEQPMTFGEPPIGFGKRPMDFGPWPMPCRHAAMANEKAQNATLTRIANLGASPTATLYHRGDTDA
jgi:hypothetical protein